MKVGEYVRTNDRGIRRIGKIIDDIFYKDEEDNLHQKGNLIKSSPNIIDLIEVGDFIGKTIVEEVKEFDDGTRIIVMADGFDEYDENEYFLKAGIVTHEQFESIEYRIGE